MNINMISTKKCFDLLPGLCYSWICIFCLYCTYFTQKAIQTEKCTYIYVYEALRNKFCFHNTIPVVEGINIWKYKHLYMTNKEKKKTSKIICTSKCTIGTSVKSWFSIHKEVMDKVLLHEKKIYDPQRKLYVSVKPTPQERVNYDHDVILHPILIRKRTTYYTITKLLDILRSVNVIFCIASLLGNYTYLRKG